MTPNKDELVHGRIDVLDYLLVLARQKKLILIFTLAGCLLSVAVALMLPNVYLGVARILPPRSDQGGVENMLSAYSGLAALAGLDSSSTPGALYVGLLQSRTISDRVIDQFDLMEKYGLESRLYARDELREHVTVEFDREANIITLRVLDGDPKQAADMANFYIEELRKLLVRLDTKSTVAEREFLEERLKQVSERLVGAEDALQVFETENKAYGIDEQKKALIEAVARLRGELAEREIQLSVLLMNATERSQEVRAMKEAIAQIKAQIRQIEGGATGSVDDEAGFGHQVSEVPKLGVQYARLLRDFKIQETLYELLVKQYEVTKIDEAKSSAKLAVLDEADVPDKKIKPRRSLIVVVATVLAGLAGIFAAFLREFVLGLDAEGREKFDAIKKGFLFRKE